jgi:sensor domain CHASE-containing protein
MDEAVLVLLIPLVVATLIFGIPIVAILTHHHRKVLEMKLRLKQEMDQSVRMELQSIRNQIQQLRDTTTQYDMSFDTALQRLESRVSHLETRSNTYAEPPIQPTTHVGEKSA